MKWLFFKIRLVCICLVNIARKNKNVWNHIDLYPIQFSDIKHKNQTDIIENIIRKKSRTLYTVVFSNCFFLNRLNLQDGIDLWVVVFFTETETSLLL